MKIRARILIQTLSASAALALVLGAVFFFSVAEIRNTVLANLSDLGNNSADISGYSLEVQLTEKINRIAQDTAFVLDEQLKKDALLLSDFSQILDATGIGRNGRLFILDGDGTKIYSSDTGGLQNENVAIRENYLESSNQRLRSLGLSMTLGAEGMTELVIDGLPVYVAYAPIQPLGWSLGVAVSVQEVSALTSLIENQIWKSTDNTKNGIGRHIWIMIGIIAFLLAASLIGIAAFDFRITQAITGPILELSGGVYEVAGGNLQREVVVNTGDELQQLAESFNMMTGQLRKHIAEIARTAAERQRINTELEIATQIQMSMLPDEFPPFPGRKNEFDLFAQVHPAKEVGGDFYDFFFIDDNRFAMIIADVSGKGIPAALFMAITKTVIKNRLQSGEEPALALEIINRQLCDNNAMNMFVTAWLCILEISSGDLTYINAGHNPPLVRRGNQDFEFLKSPPDLVLAGMDDTRYHCRRTRLEGGDMLFLYTDGISEAADTEGALYGKERLKAFLDLHAGLPLRELLPGISANIAAFSSGAEQSDDITMLAFRSYGGEFLTLRADIAELDSLTAFIDRELDAANCPQRERMLIELACEEIFSNIVEYAYDDNGGERSFDNNVTVERRLRSEPEKMTMTIVFSDHGRYFNPLDYPLPDTSLPLEERGVGGLGLLIVRKTMDTIQYSRENGTSREDGLNRLEFSKSWQKEKQ